MGSSREFQAFVELRFPEWDQLNDLIETSAVMMHRKQVGEGFMNDVVIPKIKAALKKMTADEVKMLENLVERDDASRMVLLSVIKSAMEGRK